MIWIEHLCTAYVAWRIFWHYIWWFFAGLPWVEDFERRTAR